MIPNEYMIIKVVDDLASIVMNEIMHLKAKRSIWVAIN